MTDLDVLEAIHKGTYWVKLTKLRGLGYVKGRIPRIELTKDGVEAMEQLKKIRDMR
jgi:hypothetical protein